MSHASKSAGKRLAEERAKLLREKPATMPLADMFAAEGMLATSALFPGGATGPKRYAVCDPDSRIITAYVQAAGNEDLDKYVGARVGVIGKRRYDEAVKMYVITPDRITVLSAAPTPAPKPMPKIILPPTPEPAVPAVPAG